MQWIYNLFPVLILILSIDSSSGQGTGKLIPYASGLNSVVCIVNAGDSRLFVIDQHGFINIVNQNGTISSPSFLDIHSRVVYGGERGLLGIAFHPQYKINGFFYINYIGIGDTTHISRFSVRADNPDLADPESELKLLTIYQPYPNHNGGDLNFGPEGYLYIGLGDGGSEGDPDNRSQDPKQFLGKMLRIDIDHDNPYSVPTTNPFYNSSTTLSEIWALGLRNPWRFSFDRLVGDLWIGDVGQDAIEEIDFQAAGDPGGENYGWRCFEGNQVYNFSVCNPNALYTFPVYTYPHGPECSVTGGYVYRGSPSSPYYGYYFFADYCSDRIWTLHKASGTWVKEDFGQFPGNSFSTFGEDASGQLYVGGLGSGSVFRIDDLATENIVVAKSNDLNITQLPPGNRIRIESNLSSNSVMNISVYDIRGITQFQANTVESNPEFDLGYMPSGTYFISILIDGKKSVHKLILVN